MAKHRQDRSSFKASMLDLGHVIFEITGQTPDEICDGFNRALQAKYQCDGRKGGKRGR